MIVWSLDSPVSLSNSRENLFASRFHTSCEFSCLTWAIVCRDGVFLSLLDFFFSRRASSDFCFSSLFLRLKMKLNFPLVGRVEVFSLAA